MGPGAVHRLDKAVDQKAGARRFGVREDDVETLVGLQVVVDQHAAGRRIALDRLAEDLEPRNGVEIEAEEDVGLGDGLHGTPLGVGLEDHDLLDAGHPVEEIGVFVRDDARHLVSPGPQHLGPCQRRTHGVAVGIGV